MGLSSRLDRLKSKLKKKDVVERAHNADLSPDLTSTPHVPRREVRAHSTANSSRHVESSLETQQEDSTSLPERLWNQAYDNLKREEASLVEGYEQVLSQFEGDHLDGTPLSTIDMTEKQILMQRVVKAGLERTEKEARIWEGAGAAVDFVLNAKSIIDAAVQAVPQAALAWTGVSIALQVSHQPANGTNICS